MTQQTIAKNKTARNAPCPCGSGKKFKHCCLNSQANLNSSTNLDVERLLENALGLERTANFAQATELLQQGLDDYSNNTRLLLALARVLNLQNRYIQAASHLHKAAKLIKKDKKTNHRIQWLIELSRQFLIARHPSDALAHVRLGIKLAPSEVQFYFIGAECLDRLGQKDEALKFAKKTHRLSPDNIFSILQLAQMHNRVGELQTAQNLLENILKSPHPIEQRYQIYYQLAQIHDKQGKYPEAFSAAIEAGNHALNIPSYSRINFTYGPRRIKEYQHGFSREILNRWQTEDFADDLPTPVFLMGFLRSGTTLTEQVLAAHPEIITTDEEGFIFQLRLELTRIAGGDDTIPQKLARISIQQAEYLRIFYWQQVENSISDYQPGKILVDKNSLNTLEIGMINCLFPEARIIFALRDPRDVCISCFMQAFSPTDLTVHLLTWEGTAQFYAQMMGLWLTFRNHLQLSFAEIRYEDTVNDLEGQISKILTLLKLDWHADLQLFYKQARSRYISTPSYADVSKPIYNSAIARWKNYPEQIAIITHHLGPFLQAFGYANEDTK